MIAYLEGVLINKALPLLVVNVGGVGYEVETVQHAQLPEVGESIRLFIHLQPREDALTLYGFLRLSDRELFRKLIKVSGIGPKVALGILSNMPAGQFIQAVQTSDLHLLTKLPGIGKKSAERLLLELKDKLLDGLGSELSDRRGAQDTPASVAAGSRHPELFAGLQALGFKRGEVSEMIARIDFDKHTALEAQLKAALQTKQTG